MNEVENIILIEGISTHQGIGGWFFMIEGENGLHPLLVDGVCPQFSSEEAATKWILKGEE
jgi:hypothetical protein